MQEKIGDGSLAAARAFVESGRDDGVICPCCDQLVKVYKRKFNSGMAYCLLMAYKFCRLSNPKNGWFHISDELTKMKVNAMGCEYSKLNHWGLIEPMPSDEGKKVGAKTNGMWRITEKGKKLAAGGGTVPHWLLILNNEVIKMSDEQVGIREALGDKFDYAELMGSFMNHKLIQSELF